MRACAIVLVHLIFTLLIVGCDRRPAPAAGSTTAPATTQSIAETPPEPATMMIDGHIYDFPPVKLSLEMKDDRFSALLLTDEAPNAASADYRGNSIYLQMSMDVPDTNTLAGVEWNFKTADEDRVDELDGIYMQGHRQFLQPMDVRIRIENDSPPLKVSIAGTFLWFDDENEANPPPRKVKVNAELSAKVRLKPESSSR